ncbi:unnamed protein product [Bursaphelenchus okinawaensis]|uniref:HATPase_c domain-containing protein n=1 Tax=Bursaphelenchus okinawaensis TaxID=465554 RepID=A0A811KI95_9BILA|nr:unnamed protein product [Bursaphelenchus okinawaensis]CAG9103550.1 unnamed protein product [Bursaphelenchus okinawaensis]
MYQRSVIRLVGQCLQRRPNLRSLNSYTPSQTSRIQTLRYSSTEANAEKHQFQAETRNLLDIVAKSLYSEQEVFLRELVSNSSDALEKRRFTENANGVAVTAAGDTIPYEVRVTTEGGKLIIEDTGCGMDKNELVNTLGTIAKSGSKEFRTNEQKSAESIIGQFGVGFYSALMVADKVTVITKKHDDDAIGYKWSWSGESSFEITEYPEAKPGCRIELELKDGDKNQFALPERLIEVIGKYSYFVTVPIYVNEERVNTMNAIWTMDAKDVTPEMHETFFRQLAKTHHQHLMHDRPRYTLQYKADAPLNLRVLLYIPSHKVNQVEFTTDFEDSGVSLYARKVLIKAHAKELLPRYLRFVIGVVDSEDIPLNLSREMLQKDAVILKLRRIITERVIRFLTKEMKKDRIKYTEFYNGYSMFFKEGIVVEQDFGVKEQIAQLLLFDTSNFKQGTQTSLEEYVERMQKDQDAIYYLFSPSRQLAEGSPYYESFKKQNKEVLFLHDAADEMVLLMMNDFKGKKIVSVEAYLKEQGLQTESEKTEMTRDTGKKELMDYIKDSLGSIKVFEVHPMQSPSSHPFVITAINHSAMRHVLRINNPKQMGHLMEVKPVLHVNFAHPVIKGLPKLKRKNEKLAKEVVEQVYDNALVTAGLIGDTSEFVPRINKILGDLMSEGSTSTILTP